MVSDLIANILPELTARERQICAVALAHPELKRAAAALNTSISVVNTTKRRIYKKLRVRNSTQLLAHVLALLPDDAREELLVVVLSSRPAHAS